MNLPDYNRSDVHQVIFEQGTPRGRVGREPEKANLGVRQLLTHVSNLQAYVPHFLDGYRDAAGMAARRTQRSMLQDNRGDTAAELARKAAARDTADGRRVRAACAQDADALLRAFCLELGALGNHANPVQAYQYAARQAHDHVTGKARMILNGQDSRFEARMRTIAHFAGQGARDAAPFDPTAGGSAYPGLIAQNFLYESVPLPKTHFEELFPNVMGAEAIYPGQTHYRVTRRQPTGGATVISATNGDNWPTMAVGQQSDLRGTCWLGLALEDNYLNQLQASIPGAGIVGANEIMEAADLSMNAVENKINWFGNGVGGTILGILNDPSLKPVAVSRRASSTSSDVSAVNSRTDDTNVVLDALIATLRDLNERSPVAYDTVLISKRLGFDLTRQLQGSAGMTAESIGTFLKEKVFAVAMPGITKVIADIWELDYIGSSGNLAGENGMTQALLDAMPNGMLFFASAYGPKRVPIVNVKLPAVNMGITSTLYMLRQFGEPYMSGLGQNKLLTMLG